LLISKLEVRTEEDIDVRAYVHDTKLELVKVSLTPEIRTLRQLYLEILKGPVEILCKQHAFWQSDPEKVRFLILNLMIHLPPPTPKIPNSLGHSVPISERSTKVRSESFEGDTSESLWVGSVSVCPGYRTLSWMESSP